MAIIIITTVFTSLHHYKQSSSPGYLPSTWFWMGRRKNTWTCWREESLQNCLMKSGAHLQRYNTFAFHLHISSWLNLFAHSHTHTLAFVRSITFAHLTISRQIVNWSVLPRDSSSSGLPFLSCTWSPCRWPSTRGQTSNSPWWEESRRALGTSPQRMLAGAGYLRSTSQL